MNFTVESFSQGTPTSCSSSTGIPSFARLRYSDLDDDSTSIYTSCYENAPYLSEYMHLKRILIGHPDNQQTSTSVFYYAEVVGWSSHLLGTEGRYANLFRMHVSGIPNDEVQWSSSIEWLFATLVEHWSSSFRSLILPNLQGLFKSDNDETERSQITKEITFTDDFCTWSQIDNRGTNDILFSLFKLPPSTAETLDGKLEDLFDHMTPTELTEGVMGFGSKFEDNDDDCVTQNVGYVQFGHSEAVGEENVLEVGKMVEKLAPAEKTVSQSDLKSPPPTITERSPFFGDQMYVFERAKYTMHRIASEWSWVFRQTRWPISFAPGQRVDVSMEGLRVPPWRASVGRLMADVCNLYTRRPDVVNLVLLDPMVSAYALIKKSVLVIFRGLFTNTEFRAMQIIII